MTLVLTPITEIPLIKAGDDLSTLLLRSISIQNIAIESGDILSITQKIVSKTENRFAILDEFEPSEEAMKYAEITGKHPKLIEMILSESKSVIRAKPGTIIVQHKLGFICANAGIDQSNVRTPRGSSSDTYLLLPVNPDLSAETIRDAIQKKTGKDIGVIIIDSHGRPWRHGIVGITIGTSGVPVLMDLRGKGDIFKRKLKITQVAAADELAAASSLIMGQADERIPAVHIRGFPYHLQESTISEIFRDEETDLFR